MSYMADAIGLTSELFEANGQNRDPIKLTTYIRQAAGSLWNEAEKMFPHALQVTEAVSVSGNAITFPDECATIAALVKMVQNDIPVHITHDPVEAEKLYRSGYYAGFIEGRTVTLKHTAGDSTEISLTYRRSVYLPKWWRGLSGDFSSGTRTIRNINGVIGTSFELIDGVIPYQFQGDVYEYLITGVSSGELEIAWIHEDVNGHPFEIFTDGDLPQALWELIPRSSLEIAKTGKLSKDTRDEAGDLMGNRPLLRPSYKPSDPGVYKNILANRVPPGADGMDYGMRY